MAENEQAERLAKLLADSIVEGKDFILDQAPLLAQDIVTWGRWSNLAQVAIGLLGVVAAVRWGPCFHKGFKDILEDEADLLMAKGGFAIVCGIVGAVFAAANGYWALMAWLAPKLYLMEYLR